MEDFYIAGNFSNMTTQKNIDHVFRTLKELSKTFRRLYWIPGPKEYLCDSGNITVDFVNRVMKDFCAKIKNLIVLNNEYCIDEKTLIFGSPLWEPIPDRREFLEKIYRLPKICVDYKWVTREYSKAISCLSEAMIVAKERNLSLKIITTFPHSHSNFCGEGWVID